jgi:PP-loop superfamily ATP-utilizing enzyme
MAATAPCLLPWAKRSLRNVWSASWPSSETYPSSEVEEAMETAVRLGITVMRIETDELKDADFAANTPDRCYFCKRELFGKLIAIGNVGYQNSSGNPHCNSKLKVVDL